MIKWEEDLIEKVKLKQSEAKLMTLSEEVNMKFKREFHKQGIFHKENLLKDHRLLKWTLSNKDQTSAPNMFPRAKTDKILHWEKATIFKTEKLSDQKITTCKTAEVVATTKQEKREFNTQWIKTDQEEEEKNLYKRNNNNKSNNSLSLKVTDNKRSDKKQLKEEVTTCKAQPITTTEEHSKQLMKDKIEVKKETALLLSEMIDKEVNLEARRVLNSHPEHQINFDV